MNCSLKSDRQKYTISLCSHRDLSFDPSDCDHIFVSRSRRLSPCAAHNLMKYGDWANLHHCVRFPSLLSFLDILGILGRQVSLCLPILQVHSGVLGSSSVATGFPVLDVQKCIFLSSLRTRRCVVIAISRVRFPCA